MDIIKLIFLKFLLIHVSFQDGITKVGCGNDKFCLFKPSGCEVNKDCTMALMLFVSGRNQLTVQLSASILQPVEQYQYMAVGFSKDNKMGDDSVSECVIDPKNGEFSQPEVFLSYNLPEGKVNDRIYLFMEADKMFQNFSATLNETFINCQFTQAIVPQISSRNDTIWNLNQKLYIFAATGQAEANEILSHDLSSQSHFFPIVSKEAVNPASFTKQRYELPEQYVDSDTVLEEDNATNTATETTTGTTTTQTSVSTESIYTVVTYNGSVMIDQKLSNVISIKPVSQKFTTVTQATEEFPVIEKKTNNGPRHFSASAVLTLLIMYMLCQF